jgi:hypothetical protein
MSPLAYLLTAPRWGRISQEQFLSVRVGMTQKQVEGIIGYPPGNYARPGWVRFDDCNYVGAQHWVSDNGELFVWFDRDGCVRDVKYSFILHFGEPPSFIERLRSWLRL